MTVLTGPWQDWDPAPGRTSLTIGVLDGVHLGHRALLTHLDPGLVRTVLTFEPHPVEVLRPGTDPRLITTIEERAALFAGLGVDQVGVLDLAAIKELAPEEFVDEVMVRRLDVGHVVVGVDFRFGKDRGGDVDLLSTLGDGLGFVVEPIELVAATGSPVSSSRVRELIEAGDVSGAAELLASRFTLAGPVVDGDKRGRDIGFPTANIRPPHRKVVPAHGVYACVARLDGVAHQAAVNVGTRPTFGGGEVLIEAHILDFDDDIYGSELRLDFVERLRPELAFSGVDDLVAAMVDDVRRAREILAGEDIRNVS